MYFGVPRPAPHLTQKAEAWPLNVKIKFILCLEPLQMHLNKTYLMKSSFSLLQNYEADIQRESEQQRIVL